MSENNYTRTLVDGLWDVTPKDLNQQAAAAIPGVQFVTRAGGPDITVEATPDLTAPQVTTLDALVASMIAAFDPLPETKAIKVQQIRDNTEAFIAQGAVWDTRVYMSTEQGRFDILGIFAVAVKVTDAGVWTESAAAPGFFPVGVTTTDGTYREEFVDAPEFQPFFLTMMGTYKYWKDTGRALRDQVNAATTVAEVDAIVDNRTWPMP
jgi:hypothetical protein